MSSDPDLLQAIEDLRPVFADLRKAKRDMRKLAGTMEAKAFEATREFVGDLRGRIQTRALKLALDPDALTVILAADANLKLRLKRRASKAQMAKALREECAISKARRIEAEDALRQAQGEYAAAKRAEDAACQARLIYTGFGS